MNFFEKIRQSVRRKSILKGVEELQNLTVGDIMTTYVITVNRQDDFIKAATKMIAEDISCLVVVEGTKAVGVISERDVVNKVPLTKDVFALKVEDVMSSELVSVPSVTRLPDAVALMQKKGFRRLVVVEGDKLLGIVTQTDLTRALAKHLTSYPDHPDVRVDKIMTKNVFSTEAKEGIVGAKKLMAKKDVGCMIVLDNKEILGIFTEYDILMLFYDQHGKVEIKDTKEYLRKYVRAGEATAGLFEANHLMLEKNMRRLLIVNGKEIVGIITQTDICRYIYTSLELIKKIAIDPATHLKRFGLASEIHGEFRGEHLKVYSVQ